MVTENKVSIRPSDFVEGGAVPVDRNLLWEKCSFVLFTYTKKDGTPVATTVAAKINFKDDDGQEFEQHYSVGDPERFVPSKDGKTLIPVGAAVALSKSSNFYLLLSNLVSAGFPENKLDADISTLNGLYAYHMGIPEPKRAGLVRPAPADGKPARENVLSVPSKILRLPWEKKGAKTTAKAAPATEEAGEPDEAVSDAAISAVKTALGDGDSTTRQKVATALFKAKGLDQAVRDAAAKLVFTAEFQVALLANGYAIDGETITKAE